jgi:hypothetical protein
MAKPTVGQRIGSAAEGFASGFLPTWKELRRGKEAGLERDIQGRRIAATEATNLINRDQLTAQLPVYAAQADRYAAQAVLDEQKAGMLGTAIKLLESITGGGLGIDGVVNETFDGMIGTPPPQQPLALDRILGAEPTSSPQPRTTEDILSADPLANPSAVAPFQSPGIISSSIDTPAPQPQQPQQPQQPPFGFGQLGSAFGTTNTGQGQQWVNTPTGPMDTGIYSASGPLNATMMPTMPVDARHRFIFSFISGLTPELSGMAPSGWMAPAELPWQTQLFRTLQEKGQTDLMEKILAKFHGEGPQITTEERNELGQTIKVLRLQVDQFGNSLVPWGELNQLENFLGFQKGSIGGSYDPEDPDRPRNIAPREYRYFPAMPEGQLGEFIALESVNSLLQRVGGLALILNVQEAGLGATTAGWVNAAKGYFNLEGEGQFAREYTALREAYGGMLARMGGESGGRFTDQDIARAQGLIPDLTDSQELTIRKLRGLYDTTNAMYQAMLMAAPFTDQAERSVPFPAWLRAMDIDLNNPAVPNANTASSAEPLETPPPR